jgi:pantoate kinase
MQLPSESIAFAPAAITNFFEISYNSPQPAGATGGGYILSKGSTTSATILPGRGNGFSTVVNGDASYNARTTRRAVELLLAATGAKAKVSLVQEVQTPIGAGFGASAASATSAVYAVARAAGISKSRPEIALFAHRAEILEQTGLGTVSVIFDAIGAGAITVSGEPGKAKFVTVGVPDGTRIVTAYIAPFDKKDALSSEAVSQRINRLGRESLLGFLSDPTLDNLASEGERFSGALGLESVEVKKLIGLAKSAGATHASQNMIGYAVHSVVGPDDADRVATALLGYSKDVRVDVFEVGTRRAGFV